MNALLPANWNSSLARLRSDVSDVFDRWMSRFRRDDDNKDDAAFWPASFFANGGPSADMEEDKDEVRVAVELPGLNKDEFQVRLDRGRLIVQGEKKASRESKSGKCVYSERSYGSFYRAFPLPCEVNFDKIEAKFKNGLLRLRLPKTEEAKSKQIKVTVN